MWAAASVRRRGGQTAIAAGLALAAVVLGALVVRDERMAIALGSLGIVTLLVLDGRIGWLVPGALVVLAWGTSRLPLASLAFPLKFALIGIVGLTAVGWLLRQRPAEHLPVPANATAVLGALLLFALASATWSVDPSSSIEKGLSMTLVLAATFVAVPLGLRDGREATSLLFRMSLVGAGIAVLGLVLGLAGFVDAFESNGRFQGILNNPNALGYLAAPLLPPLVVLAASEPAGRRRRAMLLAAMTLVVGIALSGSRGGSLAAFTGVVVGLLASGATGQARVARRAFVVAAVAIGAAVLAFSWLGLQVRSEGVGEGLFQLGTGSARTIAWGEAIPLIAERPLAGHGFGTTTVIFPTAQGRTDATVLGRTHNSYLEAAVDLGWTGMGWLIATILGGLLAAWRVSRLPGPDRVIGTALLAGIVGGAVEATVESGILAAGGLLSFPFWTVVALAFSLRAKQRAEPAAVARALGP